MMQSSRPAEGSSWRSSPIDYTTVASSANNAVYWFLCLACSHRESTCLSPTDATSSSTEDIFIWRTTRKESHIGRIVGTWGAPGKPHLNFTPRKLETKHNDGTFPNPLRSGHHSPCNSYETIRKTRASVTITWEADTSAQPKKIWPRTYVAKPGRC